jgi:hypothetical protein
MPLSGGSTSALGIASLIIQMLPARSGRPAPSEIKPASHRPAPFPAMHPTDPRAAPVTTAMPDSAVKVMPVASSPRAVGWACSCRRPSLACARRFGTCTLSGEAPNASSRARSMIGCSGLTHCAHGVVQMTRSSA